MAPARAAGDGHRSRWYGRRCGGSAPRLKGQGIGFFIARAFNSFIF